MENKELKPLPKKKIPNPHPYKYWIIPMVVGIILLIAGFSVKTETEVKTGSYGQTEKVINLQGTIMQSTYVPFGLALSSVSLTLFLIGKNKQEQQEYLFSLKDNQN